MKMKKMLFITPNKLTNSPFGGSKLSYYMFLQIIKLCDTCDIFECNNIDVFNKSILEKIKNILYTICFFSGNNSFQNLIKFINLVNKEKYTHVYLDGSYYGINALFLRIFFRKVKIITFFHNIEYKFYLGGLKFNKFFLFKIIPSYLNDIISTKLSHIIITISENDYDFVVSKNNQIPIYLIFPDLYQEEAKSEEEDYFNIGFIGSAFHGNLLLIEKFKNEILSLNSNIKLHIYGYGFSPRIIEKYNKCMNIVFHGSFENEVDVIKNHNIFLNSGLIKTGLQIKSLLYLKHNKIILTYSPIFLKLNFSNSVLILDEIEFNNFDFSKISIDTKKLYDVFLNSFSIKRIEI